MHKIYLLELIRFNISIFSQFHSSVPPNRRHLLRPSWGSDLDPADMTMPIGAGVTLATQMATAETC